jgi:hypothetical protein
MGGSEPAGFFGQVFGFGDVPAPVFILKELDLGFGWQDAHAFPDVLGNSDLAFACYAHNDYRDGSNT